ncbi:hypothetical protein [Clostridium ihumii]|uniref:hypothetical protein n=1 Tax=Clostridium ihumii TaxID=1470356 RepID=UPI003D335E33
MGDIITIIGVVLAIFLITVGKSRGKKIYKYIGIGVILLCLVYILPNFARGFVKGYMESGI